jgi:hypothetical protein
MQNMHRYACDECGAYVSTESDRVKARRVHQLAHLVIEADPQLRRLEIPSYQLRDYVEKRMRDTQVFARHAD